jgi:hypothetical protein
VISLALSSIRLDGGTQCRTKLDDEHIASLAEAWANGAKMPAVVIFHDGSNHWLADGFHRYHAAEKCEFRDILADVRSGTKLDAIRFALSANADHGLRRTNADKRRAVEIALKEFPKLSDRQIADVCAVSHVFVAKCRPSQLETVTSSERLGADGKTRKLPARKPAPVPPPAAGPLGTLVKRPRHARESFEFDRWKAQTRLGLSFALRSVPKLQKSAAIDFIARELAMLGQSLKDADFLPVP